MSHSSNKTFDLQATDNSIYSFCCQLLKHFQELYIKSKKLRSLAKFCEPHFTRQQTNYEPKYFESRNATIWNNRCTNEPFIIHTIDIYL